MAGKYISMKAGAIYGKYRKPCKALLVCANAVRSGGLKSKELLLFHDECAFSVRVDRSPPRLYRQGLKYCVAIGVSCFDGKVDNCELYKCIEVLFERVHSSLEAPFHGLESEEYKEDLLDNGYLIKRWSVY